MQGAQICREYTFAGSSHLDPPGSTLLQGVHTCCHICKGAVFLRRILVDMNNPDESISQSWPPWIYKTINLLIFQSQFQFSQFISETKFTGCFFTLGLPLKVWSTKKIIRLWLGVSRTIYVNVETPNIGFPYFKFLGEAQCKKTLYTFENWSTKKPKLFDCREVNHHYYSLELMTLCWFKMRPIRACRQLETCWLL